MSRVLLSLTFLLHLSFASAGRCGICGPLSEYPKRWNHMLESDPPTFCWNVYFDLAKLDESNEECNSTREKYGSACCDEEDPDPINGFPTPSPTEDKTYGECRLCGTEEVPGIPDTFFSLRYHGSYSCEQFHKQGLKGKIPDFLCAPLQSYAYKVCGCGEYNPACIEDSADCWDAEEAETTTRTSSPVSAPKVEPQVTTPVFRERKRPRPYGGKTKATYRRRGSGRNVFRGGGRRLMEGGMIPEV